MKSEVMQVQLVPVDRIRVVNPRVRERHKFEQIVQNIKTIGLKRPITVTHQPGNKPADDAFDLVCGQGRLEAFIALGQSHIPAFVRNFSRHEGLLASLIENLARRRVRAFDQIQAIRWMRDHGQEAPEIARKTGLAVGYIRSILTLLDKGEDRLLEAVLQQRIPITIATRIMRVPDEDAQRLLMEAYERKEMTQKTLARFRNLLQQRKCFGIGFESKLKSVHKRRTSVEDFVASYRAQTERQRLLIKKARACEGRLLTITAAFKSLLADEDFLTLLRAEKMHTLPKFLAERLKEGV